MSSLNRHVSTVVGGSHGRKPTDLAEVLAKIPTSPCIYEVSLERSADPIFAQKLAAGERRLLGELQCFYDGGERLKWEESG